MYARMSTPDSNKSTIAKMKLNNFCNCKTNKKYNVIIIRNVYRFIKQSFNKKKKQMPS